MFHLYTSNKQEILLEELGNVLQCPLQNVMEPEFIMVQNTAMYHWLSMKLSERFGIVMRIRFPFPNDFVSQLFDRCFAKDEINMIQYQKDVLVWRLVHILGDNIHESALQVLHSYCKDDDTGIKQYTLCAQLAELFDE